jgi:hypothetical protein
LFRAQNIPHHNGILWEAVAGLPDVQDPEDQGMLSKLARKNNHREDHITNLQIV